MLPSRYAPFPAVCLVVEIKTIVRARSWLLVLLALPHTANRLRQSYLDRTKIFGENAAYTFRCFYCLLAYVAESDACVNNLPSLDNAIPNLCNAMQTDKCCATQLPIPQCNYTMILMFEPTIFPPRHHSWPRIRPLMFP